MNRVVPRDELDDAAEVIAQQIAQAPLSVLMAIKAGVKRAWETMGMRVHLQSQFHLMWQVAAAGDVAAWREENAAKGYGPYPRTIAAQRAEAAAEAATAETDLTSPATRWPRTGQAARRMTNTPRNTRPGPRLLAVASTSATRKSEANKGPEIDPHSPRARPRPRAPPRTQLVLLTTRLYCITKIMTKSWRRQRRDRAMPDALFLVFTQPNTDQEEAEYNSRYDETHISELLEQVEGFRSARRYRLAPHPSSTSWPWPPYLAVYEIAGKTPEQIAEVLENLRIARDSTLTMSPSLGHGDRAPVRVVYVPLDGQEQDEP